MTRSEMKMSAKSETEDEEDPWIEAEIQKELDALTIDGGSSDDDEDDDEAVVDNNPTDNEITDQQRESYAVSVQSLDEYVSKVNRQMQNFEAELQECDEILQESEIVSSLQHHVNDSILSSFAAEEGIDVESLKRKVLSELLAQENARENDDESFDDDKTVGQFPDADASDAGTGDSGRHGKDEEALNGEVSSLAAVISAGSQNEDSMEFESEILEKQFKLQLKEFERTQNLKEEKRKRIEESLKQQENALAEERSQERKKRSIMIEEEMNRLNEENHKRDQEFQEHSKMLKQKLDVSLKESERRIERLTKDVDVQRNQLKQTIYEKHSREEREEREKTNAAVKIQALFRGSKIRKLHGQRVRENIDRLKEEKLRQRIKDFDERKKKETEKKLEEERKTREQEEERTRIREEEKKRMEEEKRRKEEEALKRKEEDRRRKEEEKRAKEEAKQRKKEEERRRKEEERLQKEAEKRAKEEERERKEEENRKKREEERLKKEEAEKFKREEENAGKSEEERKRKEEEEERRRSGTEANNRNSEMIVPKEDEIQNKVSGIHRQGENEVRSTEDRGQVKEKEAKDEEDDLKSTTNKKLTRKDGNSSPVRTSREFFVESKVGSSKELIKFNEENDKTSSSSLPPPTFSPPSEEVRISSKTETVRKSSDRTKPPNSVGFDRRDLEKALEVKKLAWMQENQSWSKSALKPRERKPTTSQTVPRVPSSAKSLPPLDANSLLSSSSVSKLSEVTVVALSGISPCSLKTLSQCCHLKILALDKCGLIATEGLEQATSLQYVSLTNNHLEVMNFCNQRNLVYLDVSGNRLRSIHGLTGCRSLRHLNVSRNRITRISGLESLDQLQVLLAAGNQLIATNGLIDVPFVQTLDLSDNHLRAVESIESLGMLRLLDLRGNGFTAAPALTNHVILCDLFIDRNNLVSIDDLLRSFLPSVGCLKLSQNRLSCVGDLRFLPALQSIDVSSNQIIDVGRILSGLSSCLTLESLDVNANPLVEDKNYRDILINAIASLRFLNGERIENCTTACVEISPWLSVCAGHVQDYRETQENYAKLLKSAEGNLSDILRVHVKYFELSHQMAIEHRFFHEYGEKRLPRPPVAPKLPRDERGSASTGVPSTGVPSTGVPSTVRFESAQQTIDMRAKFESALNGAKASPEIMDLGSEVTGSRIQSNPVSIPVKSNSETAAGDRSIESNSCRTQTNTAQNDSKSQEDFDRTHAQPSTDQNIRSDEIAIKAATKIKSLWRGYSLRRRLRQAQSCSYADLTDGILAVDLDELMPKESPLEFDEMIPSPITSQRSRSDRTESVFNPVNFAPNFRMLPRQAWISLNSPSPLSGPFHPERLNPIAPGKPPLPPSSRLSNLSDAHSASASRTAEQERVMSEWDFKDPRSAELFLQRQRKMNQIAQKKNIGELDPMRRLAAMRRLDNASNIHPVKAATRRREPQRIEYFRGLKELELDRERQIEIEERNQKESYTFEWIHSQVRHCGDSTPARLKRGNSEGSLPQINLGFGKDRRVAITSSPSSVALDVHSLEGATRSRHRPQSFNSDRLPQLGAEPPTPSSAIVNGRMDDRISWRTQEINRSIGWGGGKKRTNQR